MTTTLEIKGMSCPNCKRHVEEALRELPGVTEAVADHKAGTATVTHGAEITRDAFAAAIDEAGYTLV